MNKMNLIIYLYILCYIVCLIVLFFPDVVSQRLNCRSLSNLPMKDPHYTEKTTYSRECQH